VLSIKKSLTDMPVQLGTHVSNAHKHVSKAPHVRAIMCLQDVQTDSVVNTCKTCGQASTMRLQYGASTMDHSTDTAIVPSDSIARRYTADRVQRDR
jgi:hypothetical protein